jgi:hypothetical protein
MPWYSFSVYWPERGLENGRMTSLSDENEARRYARLIIRELKLRLDYRPGEQKMVVQDDKGTVIETIIF